MSFESGLSIEQYQSQALTHSKVRDRDVLGAAGWKGRHVTHLPGSRVPGTKYRDVGTVTHGVFEHGWPWFDEAVHVRDPAIKSNTKAHKAEKAAAAEAGKFYLNVGDARAIEWMWKNACAMPLIAAMLEPCDNEISIFWDAPTPLGSFGARPDFLCRQADPAYSIDLKTTASLAGFERSIFKYNYHSQAAMVRAGMRAHGLYNTEHYLLVVEKSYPNRAQLMALTPEVLDEGERYVNRWISTLASNFSTDQWPPIDEPLVDVGLPRWMEPEDDDDEEGEA